MPDPIDELKHFSVPGPAMNPMSAADVRRRGDRIRRRNNLLVTAGTLAAVAAVATPFALAAAGHESTSERPVGPATAPAGGWRQTVPAGFDITALPPGAKFSFTVNQNGSVVDDITVCGRPAFSTRSNYPAGPAVDTTGAAWGEGNSEGSVGRTLAVYPDADAASAALRGLRDAVESCPQEPRSKAGGPFVYDSVDLTPAGADESFVFDRQVQLDKDLLSDLTAFEVARVGNALYLASSYTTAGGEQASGTPVLLSEQSAPVVEQMCVFAADPCADPAAADPSSSPIGEGAVSAIPADFPLDRGLPSPEGDPVDGPSATAQGVPPLTLCGAGLWPVTGVERLGVTVTGPEYRESRELLTFARTDDVTAVLDDIRSALESCSTTAGPAGTDDQDVAAQQATVGDDSVTFSMRAQQGRGGGIYQFVRVGRSLLAVYQDGEWSADTVPAGVRDLTAASADLVPDLCTFTEQGC